MKAYRAVAIFILFAAAPLLAQEVKTPKIEPADFKDPGPVAYKFTKGKAESYTTEVLSKSVVGVHVGGQEMTITTTGTIRTRVVLTPQDDAVPTKVEVLTEHIRMKQDVDNPMMAVQVTVEDRKAKVTSGGQVLWDSESGSDNPMAAQFTRALKMIGKKVVVTVDADGRAGKEIVGDADVVKLLRAMVNQGIFPVMWKGQTSLKVGDTWEVEMEMSALESIELKSPAKFKASYKVLGGAMVDGVYCVEIETNVAGKAVDMEATTEQGGMPMALKIARMATTMKGRAYYDPAQNRVVFADQKGTVEMEASGEAGPVGSMDLKVTGDVRNITRYNVPW